MMSGPSALDLARTQFAFAIAFHIIFPALTIGLAGYLVLDAVRSGLIVLIVLIVLIADTATALETTLVRELVGDSLVLQNCASQPRQRSVLAAV
jgi:hypothetical protein